MKLFGILGLLLLPNLSLVECACHDPSPAFPPPKFDSPTPELDLAFSKITSSINQITNSDDYSTTSLSLEVTSSQRTLFTHYHTASVRNLTRPGAFTVNGSSAYRIASCTKVFTVLGILQQHVTGTLHLDDPVSKYLPELTKKQTGTLPWKDITLRALGSQLSGIPGDVIQGDLITDPANPEDFGLPPKSKEGLPTCGGFSPVRRPCTEKDLIEALRKQKPTFAPAQHSSYCNVGFEILGLVLAKASKMEYSTYIHSMLEELGIEGITFDKPGDDLAVLPAGEAWYWDVELGVHRP
jgi:CubicO group peptidase (beta-lactamase class C family)